MQRGWLAAATVSWLVAACDEAQTVQCGPGGAAVRGGDGRAYCVYRGAPDRTCPEAYPFPVDVGATRVCAEVRTTIGQLPTEVCDAIGERACEPMDAGPDAGETDAGETDAGETDAGSRDLGPEPVPDAGPDAGDPSCPLERWPTAVSIVTGAVLEPEISLATSETGELGHVHVGMIANGRARIVTRDLDVLEAPRDPPSDDLGTRWSLIADRSIALHRDRDAGDVHVLVLHDGIDGDDGVRASVGSLSAGAASSTTAPTRVMGPATHLTLGRAAILGGTEGLPRRYVWRNRIAVGNTVLASVAEDVASDYHEVPGVSHEDLAEVRGSSGRWTLAESPSDGLLLWDGSAAPPEPVAASGRASRIGFAYEGGGAYLLGYHDGAVMHVRRAACSEACVLGTESTYPIGAPPGAHVSLERLAGYVALGYANPARVELHMQLLTPALEQVRGTETPLSVEVRVGRGVVDVAVARVRHRGDEHLVFAYLVGPSGSAPDEVYLTGARFPSSCP